MRVPLVGLACVLIAAGCSNNKPAETADSAPVATGETGVTTEAPESNELSSTTSEETHATAHTADASAGAERRAVATTAPATIGGEPREATEKNDATRNQPSVAPDDTKPDNTKVNQRDTDSAALTPIDQGENAADLQVTQQIRQAVMADGTLSFTAKNVKIITRNGKVTLRGPVKTAAERASVEAAARKVAGAGRVDSQLEVAP